jgi:predicted ATPase
LKREATFIGVTGAQGVGKSTFCAKLRSVLAERANANVALADGLGEQIRALGFQVGSGADAQSVAAVFGAHMLRERNAPAGLFILDRCAIDALAYVRSLGVNTAIEKKMYEEIARSMAERLALTVHLEMSATFAQGHAAHETLLLRGRVAEAVPEIIREFDIPTISVDAAALDSVDEVAAAVLRITRRR